MSEIKLKPCPNCGREPLYSESVFYGGEQAPAFIKCRYCNFFLARTGPDSDKQVIEAWNRRAGEEAQDGACTELIKTMEDYDLLGYEEGPGNYIDARIPEHCTCQHCGHKGLGYLAYSNGHGGYRAFAVCPECKNATEF